MPSLESSLRQQAKFDLEAEGYDDEEEDHSQVQSGVSITFKLINNTQRVTPLTSSMILRQTIGDVKRVAFRAEIEEQNQQVKLIHQGRVVDDERSLRDVVEDRQFVMHAIIIRSSN